MSYLPSLPGVPPPMSYGQGYGDWHQYAGFNRTNPYGGNTEIIQQQPSAGVAPKAPIEDRSVTQPVPMSTFGAPSTDVMGTPSTGNMGMPMDIPDVINYLIPQGG
jgi:hypothetical protein